MRGFMKFSEPFKAIFCRHECLVEATMGGHFAFVFKEIYYRKFEFDSCKDSRKKKSLIKELFSDDMGCCAGEITMWMELHDLNKGTVGYVPHKIWDFKKNDWFFHQKKSKAKDYHSHPLHASVDNNYRDITLLLLQNGADPHTKDHENDTAFMIAERRKHYAILKILNLFERYKSLITQIKYSEDGHPFTCKLFKACPALASIYIKNSQGFSPLHAAVMVDDGRLAAIILAYEPRLFHETDNCGNTPMELAIAGGYVHALIGILFYAYQG